MNCLYNFCLLVFSCVSLRALSLRRCVSQVAARDVKPPGASKACKVREHAACEQGIQGQEPAAVLPRAMGRQV